MERFWSDYAPRASLRRRGSDPPVPSLRATRVMLALFWAIGVALEPAGARTTTAVTRANTCRNE
jgi:hypothetical protein